MFVSKFDCFQKAFLLVSFDFGYKEGLAFLKAIKFRDEHPIIRKKYNKKY